MAITKIPKIEALLAPGCKRTEHTKRKEHFFECVLLHIRDGDSLEALCKFGFDQNHDRMVMRLARINTPESDDPNPQLAAVAVKAKARVAELLSNKLFAIRSYKAIEKDPRGRFVVEVINDKGECVNDVLIAEKLALPYDGKTRATLVDFTPLLRHHFGGN